MSKRSKRPSGRPVLPTKAPNRSQARPGSRVTPRRPSRTANRNTARKLAVRSHALEDLVPYAKNARTHSDEQVEQIAASIAEFGWTNPVLIDVAGGIIAGHGRVLAAGKLGLAEVPCIELTGLTDAQKRAYIIADNKLALNAGWSLDLLALELQEISAEGFNVELIGFGPKELEQMLLWQPGVSDGLGNEEATPEEPTQPASKVGDVWILGKHRVACGDSTMLSTVQQLFDGASPHLMVTDPPYGVEYDAEWRARAGINAKAGPAHGKVSNDDKVDWREAWALFPGDVAYVWHAGRHASAVQISLEAAGFVTRSQIIWAKSNFVIGRGDYHWSHEPCWYAVKKGAAGHWSGDRKQTTVWDDIPKPQKSVSGHSTQKPVQCMRRPIVNNSLAGQSVYDPFLGSGTTVIAAQQVGRVCYGVELNPAYVDVAVQRWQTYTGGNAVLAGDGRSFSEVKAGRVTA